MANAGVPNAGCTSPIRLKKTPSRAIAKKTRVLVRITAWHAVDADQIASEISFRRPDRSAGVTASAAGAADAASFSGPSPAAGDHREHADDDHRESAHQNAEGQVPLRFLTSPATKVAYCHAS
jgi:hypothetical protein